MSSPAQTLITFLSNGSKNDEVWIVAGTYTSTVGGTIRFFPSKNGAKYYGGFYGDETSISARRKGTDALHFTYPTILDGNTTLTYSVQGCGFLMEIWLLMLPLLLMDLLLNFKRVMSSASGGGVWNKERTVVQNCQFINNLATADTTLQGNPAVNPISNGGGVFFAT